MSATNVKKLLIFALLVFGVSAGEAADAWRSSNTATTDSMKTLCGPNQQGILHGVCINTNIASSSMSVVNSSWTLTGVQSFGNRSTSVGSLCMYYDVLATKGLLYDKFGTADVTILYDCK